MAVKTFNTLIKLHKRRVDVMRREMLAFEEERNQLLVLSKTLHEEYAREVEVSTADARMAGFFGAYSLRVQKRQASIAEEVARLDKAIEAKAEAIRAEFAEQKKFEIAKGHAQKRIAEQEKHKLQSRFDEIGSQQYQKLQEQQEHPV